MRWIAILLILAGCKKAVDLKKEEARYEAYLSALPELKPVAKDKPVDLAVLFLEHPDLPRLDDNALVLLGLSVERLAQEIYGYKLRVRINDRKNIREYFDAAKPRFFTFPLAYPAHAFPISYFAPDRDIRLGEVFNNLFQKTDKKRLQEYLGDIATPEAGVRRFLEMLAGALAGPDLKGRPLLSDENREDERFYSYGHWSSLLQGERDFDFILTNSGIIGADNGMPLYVVARGGVTNAFIENNAYRPYQGAGVLGMYPFIADTDFFNARRGKLTREDKISAMAWLWIHELGHLLLKKDENYTFADSVHRAPATLKYMDWVNAIRETKNHRTTEIPNMKKF